jgi:hypothetical protein
MRTLSPGQLLLLAVFLLVLLLNFLLTLWHRRRTAGTTVRQLEPVTQEAPAQAIRPRSVQAVRVSASGVRPRRETPRVPAEVPPGAPRLKVSGRLGPRDARRAFVLMAILGPCRALEPQHPPAPEARGPVAPPSVGR